MTFVTPGVDSFPTTVTGKVQKYLIREAMIVELGIASDSGAQPATAEAKENQS